MTRESLSNRDWLRIVDSLGGEAFLNHSGRETKAFLRARVVTSAVDLLRLVLSYCLSSGGLRGAAAWASAVGLANMTDVALLYRLRQCGTWLERLVARALEQRTPAPAQGRLIRIVDGSIVPKAGRSARKKNQVWRIHAAFDLPLERFGAFELTDEKGGEQIDRLPVVTGEIRIGDRAYMQPERIAAVIEAGGDIVVRAPWSNLAGLDAEGKPLDLIAVLREAAPKGGLDRPIFVKRKGKPALALRLVACKKAPQAAEAARREARRAALKHGHTISKATLEAADFVIIVTSLSHETYSTADILDLYRLRWRIELGFKRLKSLIGLAGPPGVDQRSAKPWILAHLLAILLLEPFVDELEDSPRWPIAA
jgi:hypothetical protein